jgi:hypothetical protein
MSIILTIILGLFMGVVFGFVLEKARVFEPGIIIEQFYLRNFIMLKVFLTAIVTGLIVFTCFFALGFERLNWKMTIYLADLVGGVLLGIGIALAGACPGTVFVQIGAGYKDAIATCIGCLCGSLVYIKLQPWLKDVLLSGAPQQRLTLDGLFNTSLLTVSTILAVFFIIVLYMLERRKSWKEELGETFNGCD